jgi:hypothetical protein
MGAYFSEIPIVRMVESFYWNDTYARSSAPPGFSALAAAHLAGSVCRFASGQPFSIPFPYADLYPSACLDPYPLPDPNPVACNASSTTAIAVCYQPPGHPLLHTSPRTYRHPPAHTTEQ